MKIALTNQDTINIDIQLDKNAVTHSSSNYDLITLTAQIAEKVKEHLVLLHTAKQQEENTRIEQEKAAAKKRRRFSNFSEDVSTTQSATTTFKQAVSLATVQKRMEQDGLLMNSGLPEVVRFRNSPYVYTVKATEWSSPFGSTGTEVAELLQDIAQNIYKMGDSDTQAFVLKYTR